MDHPKFEHVRISSPTLYTKYIFQGSKYRVYWAEIRQAILWPYLLAEFGNQRLRALTLVNLTVKTVYDPFQADSHRHRL